jgi:dihydrofolate synthase/folylpolyglutamate synthase
VSALEQIFALEQFGIKLGLENIRALCTALGDPQRAFATVIIGGTNGKGSVTAMVDCALRAAGHRSARYTSPHLVRIEERFVIDGREIEPASLETGAARVLRTIDSLLEAGTLQAPPTFFEATTALAFERFREAGASIAVLEVGLGGRLDATNVADALAAAITSIDRDHEQQLGGSLEQVAFEKAGIIKRGRPVIVGPLAEGPRRVILDVAKGRDASIVDATPAGGCRAAYDAASTTVELTTPVRGYPRLTLGLTGRHQIENALVAARLLETIDALGIRVGADAIAQGLTDVRWPGRLEWLTTEGGRLLLDAAHNPAGARSLGEYLRSIGSSGTSALPLVFGVAKDKDLGGMLRELEPVVSRVIATQAATPRALDAEQVAARVRQAAPSLEVRAVKDPIDACRLALTGSERAVVTGSIFLIGDVRGRLAR